MVKGINRQVILVKPQEAASMFDQAIFILREGALEKDGIGERELLEEARKLADSYAHRKPEKKRRCVSPLLWMTVGALPVAAAWILTVLL